MKKTLSLLTIFVLTGSCVVASENSLPGLDEQRIAAELAVAALSSDTTSPSSEDTAQNAEQQLAAAGLPSDNEASDLPGDDNSSFDRVENVFFKAASYSMQLAYGMAGRAIELARRARQSLEDSSEDPLKESAGDSDAEKNADTASQPNESRIKKFLSGFNCFPTQPSCSSVAGSDGDKKAEDPKDK